MNRIRRYRSSDAGMLVDVYNEVESGKVLSENQLTNVLNNHERGGGKSWILVVDGQIKGFATLTPVPALEGLFDLGGGIAVDDRRRGFGSQMLRHVINDRGGEDVRQINYAVDSLDSPVARFLRRNDFGVEHEEWKMDKDNLSELRPIPTLDGYLLKSYRRSTAIKRFRELYESSFAGLVWYQPYLSDAEVTSEMEDDDSIIFLLEHGVPVGFIWLRWPETMTAEIEPVGIVESRQGRGLGRYLVENALRVAADQGADRVTIGVWSENETAIRLYLDLGFRQVRTVTYLAYNLSPR